MDDLYLDNIDEFVHDHNKIVTYKWLSLTLGVHVNQAKQMLFHYLDQKRKDSSGSRLHATYLVSGKCLENGIMGHKVAVVREDQLEDVKSKMEATASVHVYSIQKAVLKDSGPLYSTDYDAVKENLKNCSKYSAIRCSSAVPMSAVEVQRAQEKAQAPPPPAAAATESSRSALNGHAPQASKPAAKQPKGIMGMFASKSSPKTQECSKEVKTEVEEDTGTVGTSKSKPSPKMNAMNHFFGKATTSKPKPSTESSDRVIKEEVGGPQTSSSANEKPSVSPPKAPVNVKQEKPKSSEPETKKSKDRSSKSKRLELSDSEDERLESQKKRRRIKKPQLDSSDEEVIPETPPSRDVETPTPSPESHVKKESAPQAEENVGGRRRKRRKVLKPHTFLDEEGCIVTEKKYESESYSESEDDFKASKPPPKEAAPVKPPAGKRKEEDKRSQKKAAANKTTKQASIMGFFQKK
ncbi:DNA polymerase delta subunit 3 isoform X1 [Conger conger]|uniref:DNA polymerase delta subunit 3 isoform X1 n=1 Tax=Conger conger TaxID=82655 RepID=UPI002A5AD662|nr:DNA polymerase delta subunit 3 isoform X1 [Conger conger]